MSERSSQHGEEPGRQSLKEMISTLAVIGSGFKAAALEI